MRMLIGAALLLMVSGCGSSPQVTAATTAAAIKAAVPQVQQVVALNGRNDPNHLLGRNNGYVAGAVMKDSRIVKCNGRGFGSTCGAMIEQWPTANDAKVRMDYIVRLEKSMPILGSEYDTLRGDLLLRVDGHLSPTQAAVYRAAFLS